MVESTSCRLLAVKKEWKNPAVFAVAWPVSAISGNSGLLSWVLAVFTGSDAIAIVIASAVTIEFNRNVRYGHISRSSPCGTISRTLSSQAFRPLDYLRCPALLSAAPRLGPSGRFLRDSIGGFLQIVPVIGTSSGLARLRAAGQAHQPVVGGVLVRLAP